MHQIRGQIQLVAYEATNWSHRVVSRGALEIAHHVVEALKELVRAIDKVCQLIHQ